MGLKEGDKAPAFSLPDQDGKMHKLADYKGKWVLLYFYPKDFTPGCTKEACGMRDNIDVFKKLKTVVLGVSLDSINSHKKFAQRHELPFPLLSDENKKVSTAYGAYGEKKMAGRRFLGVKRISFLIDPKGKISKIYGKVRSARHAAEVIEDLKA